MANNGVDYDRDAVREVLDKARAEGRDSLTAPEGRRVCEAYGIPTPWEGLAGTADEAVRLAGELGAPVAMKIVSPDILHKTEAGGVKIGVSGDDAVRSAYAEILSNAKAYNADATVDGIQVQQMLSGGQEVIVGATTDPTFGKVIVFGLGGVLVEVAGRVDGRRLPLQPGAAVRLVDDVSGAETFARLRGQAPWAPEPLVAVVEGVAELWRRHGSWLHSADLNPLVVTADGVRAVDALLVAAE